MLDNVPCIFDYSANLVVDHLLVKSSSMVNVCILSGRDEVL